MRGFDSVRYIELAGKVTYARRSHSDGLCCFLDEKQSGDFGLNPEMVLVRQRELKACEHLELRTEAENGKLNLEFRCGIHDNGRPDECVEHPENPPCFYVSLLLSREIRPYFLSFSADKFPKMERFAYETTNGQERRFLVPLPLPKSRY